MATDAAWSRDELVEMQRALRAARKDRHKQNASIRDYADQDPAVPAEMRAAGGRRLAAIESALAKVDAALTTNAR